MSKLQLKIKIERVEAVWLDGAPKPEARWYWVARNTNGHEPIARGREDGYQRKRDAIHGVEVLIGEPITLAKTAPGQWVGHPVSRPLVRVEVES